MPKVEDKSLTAGVSVETELLGAATSQFATAENFSHSLALSSELPKRD